MTPPPFPTPPFPTPPFPAARLDALLDQAGIDVLLASAKHSLRYLLGGHHHHFFAHMDAIGISRYLPLLVYPRGRAEDAAYIAFRNERDGIAAGPGLWPGSVQPVASSAPEAMAAAIAHLRRLGPTPRTLGVELAFLPADAFLALRDAVPDARIVDANRPLELLRAVKTPAELARLRAASERVVDAMLEVIAAHGPGTTKRALEAALRQAEATRGLTFEYALITVGAGLNRAPSDETWQAGDILSIDSGGNLDGYIGDLCRMAVLGEPDAELQDLLAQVDAVQMAARTGVRPGAPGRAIYDAVQGLMARMPPGTSFVAHGMGLIGHEAPRLTASGPVPYPADDADLPLQPGMVISIETTLPHARRGFIKLEDTVAVTEQGWEAYGDRGRGWNRGAA